MRHYRLTLVACVLSWFMLGMHYPMVHQMTQHGLRDWSVLLATLVLAVLAVTSLWLLLRAPSPGAAHANGQI